MGKKCGECGKWHSIDFPNGTPTEYGVCEKLEVGDSLAEAPHRDNEACAEFKPKEGEDESR
jgi:hypothetical protein